MVHESAIDAVWFDYRVGEVFKGEEHKSGGHWSADFVYDELKTLNFQLWLVLEDREKIKAALITDIKPYPNGLKTCMVTIIVGKEPRSWIQLRGVLEEWAKRSGCERIEAIGRLGWKRVIPDWKPTFLFFEKKL